MVMDGRIEKRDDPHLHALKWYGRSNRFSVAQIWAPPRLSSAVIRLEVEMTSGASLLCVLSDIGRCVRDQYIIGDTSPVD